MTASTEASTGKRKTSSSQLSRIFRTFTGHDIDCIRSYERFVELMHRPTDGAALGVARMLFGLTMLIDIPEERGGGDLDLRWGEPRDCHFPLIHSMVPPALPRMGLVYLLMWLGALGIALGYRYRLSAFTFAATYWYVFLLDKSAWNNHSYLYGLLGSIFLFTDAHRYCSIDALLSKQRPPQLVPFWNYFLLKYQFFILYFLAGLKKLCREWLSGYAMTNLSYHWVFLPFRLLIGPRLTDLLVVHWFGCLFDTTVAFFLIYAPTRRLATIFASAFHLMNSRLFHIGMFPWVCLAQLPLYYSFSWPRRLLRQVALSSQRDTPKSERPSTRQRFTVSAMLVYCAVQLFLPYSHFITKGYNNWTNGLYGYSWDMMVHAWDTVMIGIKVVDHGNGEVHFIEPYAFTDNDRWTKHADMAVQFARCIKRNIDDQYRVARVQPTNVSIYFDIWCSMNGRFQQRVFDPETDVLRAPWSPFATVDWVLPLLHQFSGMRESIGRLTEDVLSWSNHSDALFIADYPGLSLRNYISPQFHNVTLTVLEGAVRYALETDTTVQSLAKGQRTKLVPGAFHVIETVSSSPSCYMYTFVNRTKELEMLQRSVGTDDTVSGESTTTQILPLKEEFLHRLDNYIRFMHHVGNSLLYEIYGVPMPRRVRHVGRSD